MADVGDYMDIVVETKVGDTLTDTDSVSVVVLDPNGVASATIPVPRESVGTYVLAYGPLLTEGAYTWTATASGPISGVFAGMEMVGEWRSVVSVAEVQSFLRSSRSESIEQLRMWAAAATEACERYTGRAWTRRTVMEQRDGGRAHLTLWQTPVLEVVGVTEGGVVLGSSGYNLGPHGILRRSYGTFAAGTVPGNVVVTYVVGPDGAVPQSIRLGVLELIAHFAQMKRGGTGRPGMPGASADETWQPGASFAIPRRVAGMWDLFPAVDGFA